MILNRHALQAFRELRGLTVTELAKRAGVTQSYVSNIEAGQRVPSGKVTQDLADALGVDVLAITSQPIVTKVAA